MKPLNENKNMRLEILRHKRRLGMLYGAAAGISFAVASWGWDGYGLSAAHGYYPWVMFLTGLIFSALFGTISGWLTARFESSLLGALFWLAASAGFAWLMVALPLQINPAIVSALDPQLGALLNYQVGDDFIFRFGASLAWVLPFALLVGVTQLPISESAAFSTSFFGKIAPLFFSILLMGISGTFTDNLVNAHFRDAIVSLDTTIQFVVDNQGNEKPDPVLSRQLHARALWEVKEQVRESRRLFVGGYDENLGEFQVLVKFGDQWTTCLVLYNQPSSCKPITGD